MHLTYAVMDGNTVENVVVVDDTVDPHTLWPTWTLRRIEAPAGIGWTWNEATQTFDPPASSVETP